MVNCRIYTGAVEPKRKLAFVLEADGQVSSISGHGGPHKVEHLNYRNQKTSIFDILISFYASLHHIGMIGQSRAWANESLLPTCEAY